MHAYVNSCHSLEPKIQGLPPANASRIHILKGMPAWSIHMMGGVDNERSRIARHPTAFACAD